MHDTERTQRKVIHGIICSEIYDASLIFDGWTLKMFLLLFGDIIYFTRNFKQEFLGSVIRALDSTNCAKANVFWSLHFFYIL